MTQLNTGRDAIGITRNGAASGGATEGKRRNMLELDNITKTFGDARAAARNVFVGAGADAVIDTMAELPKLLSELA